MTTVALADQIAYLERVADEIGPTPEMRAAIKTLRLIDEFPDEVREALRAARDKKRVMADPVARKVAEALAGMDAVMTVRDREPEEAGHG